MKTRTTILLILLVILVAACFSSGQEATTPTENTTESTAAASVTLPENKTEENKTELPTVEYDCDKDLKRYQDKLTNANEAVDRAKKRLAEATPEDKDKRQKYLDEQLKTQTRYQGLVDRGKARCGNA